MFMILHLVASWIALSFLCRLVLDLNLNLELWPSTGAVAPTSQALRGKFACTFLEGTFSVFNTSPLQSSTFNLILSAAQPLSSIFGMAYILWARMSSYSVMERHSQYHVNVVSFHR